jgi:hypothetical protein
MSAVTDAVAYLLARDAGAPFDSGKSASLYAAVAAQAAAEDQTPLQPNEQGGTAD